MAHFHSLRVLTARYPRLTPASGELFRFAARTALRLGTEHGKPIITALSMVVPERLSGVAWV